MSDNAFARRRSVDVGGLALALSDGSGSGSGHGWGGWEETESGETRYAEVLIDVRAHTETIVNKDLAHQLPFTHPDALTRQRLVQSLDSWDFEPHKLPDEQVLTCSYILFEALYRVEGMEEAIGVPLIRLAAFLQHLRQVYRSGNSYHNFQHALDVFQATYYFLYRAGTVPPVSILLQEGSRSWRRDKGVRQDHILACLTSEDLFALLIAAVGHDVGHPGLTNAFMKNAKTPLAVIYDDKSVLEQMHYALISQLMRHYGLGNLLDRPTAGLSFRKLLLGTVLATDLSLHAEFMTNFRGLVDGENGGEHKRKVLACQALIKCADISNPSRPYSVSKHWVDALESEWTCQVMLEQHLHLPATVKPSNDSLGEARGQVWFITTFVRPLFELVSQGIPELEEFAQQCRENLAMWERKATELSARPKPEVNTNAIGEGIGEIDSTPTSILPPRQPPTNAVEDFRRSAFPPTLPESFRSVEEQPFSPTSAFMCACSPPSSSDSSDSHSHYESCESMPPSPFSSSAPPSQPPSTTSAVFPPSTTHVHAVRPPSVSSSVSVSVSALSAYSSQAHDATVAIRAAYRNSVRKKKSASSTHRSSWTPSLSAGPHWHWHTYPDPSSESPLPSPSFPTHYTPVAESAGVTRDTVRPIGPTEVDPPSPHSSPLSVLSQTAPPRSGIDPFGSRISQLHRPPNVSSSNSISKP